MKKLGVVSSYMTLIDDLGLDGERVGDEYKCSCPFHSEETPSMFINVNSGRFYCFGCSKETIRRNRGERRNE